MAHFRLDVPVCDVKLLYGAVVVFGWTYHSTAHTAVMELCTKDVAMFLHFHAFLRAESGMGSLLTVALTSVKKPKEEPVVKITELNSIAGKPFILPK